MNAFDFACAIFSAAAYQQDVKSANRIDPIAPEIAHVSLTGSGFEASAYDYQGVIVIAYTATDCYYWQEEGHVGQGFMNQHTVACDLEAEQ